MALNQSVLHPQDTARDKRYAAQRVQWAESSLKSVSLCGWSAASEVGVAFRVTQNPDGSRTPGFGNLYTCGSVWACAVCNAKIAARRADEVANAIRTWEASSPTRYVAMVTLTMRHRYGQALAALWDCLSYAWSKTTSGRQWKDEQAVNGAALLADPKFDESGCMTDSGARIPWVRFVESTVGANGWHLHVHSLLFLDDADGDGGQHDQIGRRMFNRWSAALVRKGLEAPDLHHGGLDVTRFAPGAEDVGKYVAKATYDHADRAGLEAAGGAMKDAKRGNRTPFSVLRNVVATGDADDLDLWHEWEAGSKGRRQVAWARGFRQWLQLEDEKTDEEIAAEDLDGETVNWADEQTWGRLRHHKGEILRAMEVLPLPFLRSAPPGIWLTEYRTRYRDLPAST